MENARVATTWRKPAIITAMIVAVVIISVLIIGQILKSKTSDTKPQITIIHQKTPGSESPHKDARYPPNE